MKHSILMLFVTSLMTLLLVGCGESEEEKTARKQAEYEKKALALMPPSCDSPEVMNQVKWLIRKHVDPFNIGKNKQYSGITEVQRLLNVKEYRCRGRLTYNYSGAQKNHYLEYSVYWLDDKHERFQVEMTTITNNY